VKNKVPSFFEGKYNKVPSNEGNAFGLIVVEQGSIIWDTSIHSM
jgi:hypothetical protein